MHLYAIGIYTNKINDKGERELIKITFAQKTKPSMFDRNPNDLEELEQKSFPQVPATLERNAILHFQDSKECHHFMLSSSGDRLLAISRRADPSSSELSEELVAENRKMLEMLFRNIDLALQGKIDQLTLEKILINPLGYAKSDAKLDKIQQDLGEVIKVMHKNIETAIQRGQSLAVLKDKTLALSDHSKLFKDKAAELNRCRCM